MATANNNPPLNQIALQIQARIDDLQPRLDAIRDRLKDPGLSDAEKDRLRKDFALTEKQLLQLAMLLSNGAAMALQAAGAPHI